MISVSLLASGVACYKQSETELEIIFTREKENACQLKCVSRSWTTCELTETHDEHLWVANGETSLRNARKVETFQYLCSTR